MEKRECRYCDRKLMVHNASGMCPYHRNKWARTAPIAKSAASHKITRLAVLSGILPTIDEWTVCADCGGKASECDHRDYMKPLDVDPVCRSCNKLRGAALNNTKPVGGNKAFDKMFNPINRSYTGKPVTIK